MEDCVLVRITAGHRVSLTLHGEIDLAVASQLLHANTEVASAAPRTVQLDLQRVTFFSAAGLGFLTELLGTVDRHHAALTVAPIPQSVSHALEAAGMTLPGLTTRIRQDEASAAGYGARGGLWEALIEDFPPEEQAALRQTVVHAVHQQRRTARASD